MENVDEETVGFLPAHPKEQATRISDKLIKMKKTKVLDFDDVLVELGELGRFQIYIYILVCVPVIFAALNGLSYVFTAGVPNYRCYIPECEDPRHTTYDAPWVQWAKPQVDESNQLIGVKVDACDRYVSSNESMVNGTCTPESFTSTVVKCSEWIFDDSEKTIVNDWNITCLENQWKVSFVGTSHFAGYILGSLLFGFLADWYGRRKIFIVSIFTMSLSGAAQVLSPGYITFVILIFANAVGTAGVFPLAFVLGVEMVGVSKREFTGIVLNYFFAIGETILAPLAWYTKDWISLQLVVSVPAIIFVGYYWIVPESVRWLLAKERREEAKKVVFKVARSNKVVLSDKAVDLFRAAAEVSTKDQEETTEKFLPVIKRLLTSRKLIIRFLITFFIWGVNAFVFYGLSTNSTSLGGNKYINFALVSVIEIPGITLSWICVRKLGRRISLVGSLLLCGATCTLTVFVNSAGRNWAVITLFLLGKLGVTSAFAVVYVHTAEMLPTIVRSGGVGAASTFSRAGALLAPFVPMLGLYYTPLPMLVFGCVAVLAGLLAIKLPETLGVKLPETVEEAEQL